MAGPRAMISCCKLVDALRVRGWTTASGVPCSTFEGPIAHLAEQDAYEASANEGLAFSSAAGAALAGQRQVVVLQNSGLGNLINPLTSLAMPYEIPVLVLMSLRGWPDPATDEPQHRAMGARSRGLLDGLGVRNMLVEQHGWLSALDAATAEVNRGRSAFLLFPRKSIDRHPYPPRLETTSQLPSSADVAEVVAAYSKPSTVVFATTGNLSRYLFASGDRPANFYMQGSMGHVASLALGFCRAQPSAEVLVLDGDGAALMHLGVMSTIGAAAPPGLVHVIVDNKSYATTGGQQATSRRTALAGVAKACGYATACFVESREGLEDALTAARMTPGPHCVVVSSRITHDVTPPRASSGLELREVARRLTHSVPVAAQAQ
jgi:phosphonopyruvate decarboxylase